jgi:hypothetical protein
MREPVSEVHFSWTPIPGNPERIEYMNANQLLGSILLTGAVMLVGPPLAHADLYGEL